MKLKLAGGTPKSGKGDAGVGQTPAGQSRSVSPAPAAQSAKPVAPAAPAAAAKESSAPEVEGPHAFPPLTEEEMRRHYAEPLPSFRDVGPGERQALFVSKLHLCAFTFDFTDPASHVHEKETKRLTLLEMVDYVNSGSGKFREALAPDLVFMVSSNIFRSLPPPRPHALEAFDAEEEEPSLEPAWPHLQIVYELLLRFIVSGDTDAKTAKKFVDQQFVLHLLDLFDSGKFMVHRPFIRKAINYVFYHFVFETERHNGIAELLEILGSIINGFALPLKDEHKNFLIRALLPLHKPKCLPQYHQQLSYCITQAQDSAHFVEKDPELAVPVLQGLLKFWPITNSHKEVLFIGELEEVLEITKPKEFEIVIEPLFRRISRCLTSSHFQVAERSLFLWNNDAIVLLVTQYKEKVLPLVIGALEENAAHHWNSAVHSLTLNVRKMFQEMDVAMYNKCLHKMDSSERSAAAKESQRQDRWDAILRAAKEPSMQVAASNVPPKEEDAPAAPGSGLEDLAVVSLLPTRHFWIGNLSAHISRAVLTTVFDQFGTLEDVVTFPGRMYAFVNFRRVDDAVSAHQTLQGLVIPELTGDRPLLLKYRPATTAEAKLRALGHGEEAEGGGSRDGGAGSGSAPTPTSTSTSTASTCQPQSEPSARIWLGNIAMGTTVRVLQSVLSRFGPLLDAAVFPARIGPLGYAFARFERVEDAVAAFTALNNTVVPALSGGKQLKMRYKARAARARPAGPCPVPIASRLAPGSAHAHAAVSAPRAAPPSASRHLWLGNVGHCCSEAALVDLFGRYGQVESVRLFALKAYAFVNFVEVAAARRAMSALDGAVIPALTGTKGLVMRYQQEPTPGAAAARPPPARALADLLANTQAAALVAAALTHRPPYGAPPVPLPSPGLSLSMPPPTLLQPQAWAVAPSPQLPAPAPDLLGALSRLLEAQNSVNAFADSAFAAAPAPPPAQPAPASPPDDGAARAASLTASLACMGLDQASLTAALAAAQGPPAGPRSAASALAEHAAMLQQVQAMDPAAALQLALAQPALRSLPQSGEGEGARPSSGGPPSARQSLSLSLSPDSIWNASPSLRPSGSPDTADPAAAGMALLDAQSQHAAQALLPAWARFGNGAAHWPGEGHRGHPPYRG
ncbi:hypothetical protein QBZ16_001529 [Prototheca wickerhamii]|uniref:RRM domain-containing protein n=1 Tax=Prototheca wickerhamii TaxID=3111 RepID=A0AAD9IDD2_PROWI|nr:hypothetical protein QBZ16_001529 [Prototheca wickerhamii]